MKRAALLLVITLVANVLIAQSKWVIDKNHTDIRFTAIHYVISEVDGEFKEFDGSVTTKSDGFEGAEIEFVAQVGEMGADDFA